ncbi:Ketosteroid isomerase-related protein [hydrothermal vent metagenome]|uniref:Ketosteroid isomerase-related protein n=1 Tax=hydrothermal vent metagenome TaxID=652676 RepID=A0A3B0WBQ5_9ZZZZ
MLSIAEVCERCFMSQENEQLIRKFYTAFQQRDHVGMIACYHSDVHFSDPVFTDLRGKRAIAMWHMLCERGKDLQISFDGVQANGNGGQAHWEATYSFSASKRKVHNIIDANFRFADGLIMRHADSFDLWRWTRMALGPAGVLLGWSSFMQKKVRKTAVSGLDKFIANHPEYQS